MKPQGLREVYPNTLCSNKDCTLGHMIGTHPAVAFRHDITRKTYVFHIGCAPPRLRQMYYAQQREDAARGR